MLLILLACFVILVIASPVSVNIPLGDQLPPTARLNVPYSWTFASASFVSDSNASLTYTVPSLPDWLTFEPTTRTFHGTPSSDDEGHPEITVFARDSPTSSSASSRFSFCVSSYAAPTVSIPIEQQFETSNPSLSSVFSLSNGSALSTSSPALRIPPAWSFSVGIESGTFSDIHAFRYAALQADGSPLPSWIRFNPSTITFNGFTPIIHPGEGPVTVSLAIHVTDDDGYSSAALPFDLIVARHELHSTHPLPTINITAQTLFNMSLNSAFDFSGMVVDDEPIQSSNISKLSIDVSRYGSWLRYDASNRQLSGTSPASLGAGALLAPLPVTLVTEFNQTIQSNVSIAVVPSYFTAEVLGPLKIKAGEDVHFGLAEYVSSGGGRSMDIDMSAAFDPSSAGQFFSFNNATSQLSGKVPPSIDYNSIKVTFTAYSHVTHSTSHTSLDLSISDIRKNNALNPSDIPSSTRSKLILGVGIASGIVGGVFVLLLSLAICRRCTKVRDTALEGEEGRRGWTQQEKEWYGLDDSQPVVRESVEKMVVDFRQMPNADPRKHGPLGLGIKRWHNDASRSPHDDIDPLNAEGAEKAVMKKAEFFQNLRATVRVVSDKYRIVSERIKPTRPRLVIGKPTLLTNAEHSANERGQSILDGGPPASFSLGESPSSSTQTPSIPRRRADFAPRSPLSNKRPAKIDAINSSMESILSNAQISSRRTSIETHAHEAVVHTARAMSVRSGQSVSFPYPPQTTSAEGLERPRLVPFTKSSRVPVPQVSINGRTHPNLGPSDDAVSVKRITSLSAEVQDDKRREDDFGLAMDYVRTLGTEKGPRSFYSLESSQGSAVTQSGVIAHRFLARVGERFVFTVCVTETERPEVRLVSGESLPEFVHVNVRSEAAKGMVQLWGTPREGDVGEVDIGVYSREDGRCVGRAVGEEVGRT